MGGLIEGATVRLAGVQIGRVTAVVLPGQPGGKVRVTLTIARRFSERIREDSEARIATQGLLGDKIVEISIGTTAAPALKPGDVLATQDPFEMQQMFKAGAETLQTVRELAASLKGTAERVDRIAKEVETGKGLVHALVYDEPEALTKLNAILTRTQSLLARAEQGDHAVGVLLSPDSGKSVRALLAAMDTIGRTAEKLESRDNLISALLHDPQYKTVADDLRVVAHNFRDVSERVAQGQGLLGQLTRDGGTDGALGSLGDATADFRVAMANLRAVTDRLKQGEGTVGALLEDPTVYENLVAVPRGRAAELPAADADPLDDRIRRAPAAPAGAEAADGAGALRPIAARRAGSPRAKPGTCPDCARVGDLVAARGGAGRARAGPARPGGSAAGARPQPIRRDRGGRRWERVASGHGRAGPRPGRRRGDGLPGPHRRRSRDRQVHPPAPGQPAARRAGRVRCSTSRARSRPPRSSCGRTASGLPRRASTSWPRRICRRSRPM